MELFFLDSGAHSLYTKHVINKKHAEGYGFYRTREFWDYVDDYAEFVKANLHAVDYYANVDVIFNPKLSWKVLKYLEREHDLKPVPVIHYGTDIEWIKKHLDAGYDYIGLGGLGQEVTKQQYYSWADRVYSLLCPGPSRLPRVRTHGFAMTAYPLLHRYPWYSVDSASWVKAGGFGIVIVPHLRGARWNDKKQEWEGGEFVFAPPPNTIMRKENEPYPLTFSDISPAKSGKKHYYNWPPKAQAIMRRWLQEVNEPLGEIDRKTGKEITPGVITHHAYRKRANLKYFQRLVASLPEWPWPFKPTRLGRKGFAIQ